jgi:hypothetical protein
MMYFPKSQIQINLYTNGGQLSLISNNSVYKGYYFKTSTGKYYTEKQPSKKGNHELKIIDQNLSFTTNPSISDSYDEVLEPNLQLITGPTEFSPKEYSKKVIARQIPTLYFTHPTNQDKQNGFFTRYFCKKNNELKYIEISKNMFLMFQNKDSKVAWDLYTPVSVQWAIKGTNVESTNSYNINMAARKANFIGFSQFFKNLSLYKVDESQPTLSTSNFPINKGTSEGMGGNMNTGGSY